MNEYINKIKLRCQACVDRIDEGDDPTPLEVYRILDNILFDCQNADTDFELLKAEIRKER